MPADPLIPSPDDKNLPLAEPADVPSLWPEKKLQKLWLVLKAIQARLRFFVLLAAVGLVLSYWSTLTNYYEKWTRPRGGESTAANLYEYFCSMHPSFVTDNPKEKCPICHMGLTRRQKGSGTPEPLPPGVVARVQLSPYRIALAGVQTSAIGYQRLPREIDTVGFVEFDERHLAHIAARVKGRIDRLAVNVTGQKVNAGEELASIYSPDLVVTVQNLLDAQRADNRDLMRNSRERLALWGIDDQQIAEILRTGKANTHLTIRSPITGHVIRKYQVEGKYVEEGTSLYDLAELSTVWIQAQVYEDDLPFLKEGQKAIATTPAFPDRKFEGKLAFIHPHLDRSSRTLTVRFDMANPEHELRPGMYATVRITVPTADVELYPRVLREQWREGTALDLAAHAWFAPAGPMAGPLGFAAFTRAAVRQALLQQGYVLTVPQSAVIDTGKRKIVYRESAAGIFDGVEVQLGPRGDIYFPVLRGLEAGDRVVTTGSFLIDAETRLNPAAGSIYFGGTGGTKNERTSATVPPAMPADAEVRANRAKLSASDRRLVEAQEFCPVQANNRLGSMGTPDKIVIDGQPVFLCCKGCREQALENPGKTLAKVEELKRRGKKEVPR